MMYCHNASGRWIALLSLVLPVAACTAGGGGNKFGPAGTGGAGTGAAGSGATPGSGGGATITGLGGTGPADGGHATMCDDAGNNCTCITIASIGHEGVWGPCSSDSTTALQNWLNTQSTAKVDNYDTTKPTLTAEFLAKYDVILLQWMVQDGKQNDDGAPWVFSASEVSALQTWVNNGGGLIALTGYQCNSPGCIYDTTATNQLLSFTDIQFNEDTVLDPSKVSCQDCYCWGGPIPLGGPLPGSTSVGTWDQTSPIGAHVTDVGMYDGRSIKSTTATVDCTDGTTNYAVHETIGKGHVFAYGDEWVTYSGEWLGTATCLNASMFTNPSDPCYQKSAAQVFQIPQFWYNAIKYAASGIQCFDISNPGIQK